MDERTFGQRLRATRIKAGYSQSELEEISGIPKARLSRYENGHVAPSIQTLERLARALGRVRGARCSATIAPSWRSSSRS